MESLLEMKGISKYFAGVRANNNVNFSVERGEVHALLGENGAGKTTLMNVLYGLYTPTAGTIIFDGKPVQINCPQEAIQLGIGMVHQHFMLASALTAVENVILDSVVGQFLENYSSYAYLAGNFIYVDAFCVFLCDYFPGLFNSSL